MNYCEFSHGNTLVSRTDRRFPDPAAGSELACSAAGGKSLKPEENNELYSLSLRYTGIKIYVTLISVKSPKAAAVTEVMKHQPVHTEK